MREVPVYTVSCPEYSVEKKPDAKVIGKKIDALIKKHFLRKKVIIRCIGSQEHEDKTVDELIAIIKRLGTDRYDPQRVGDRYENLEEKQIDIFALDFFVEEDTEMLKDFIEPFFTYPVEIGKEPVRLDIVIIYDATQLNCVIHSYENGKDKYDGFAFRDPRNKTDALLGIIKII
tara:strand:- start:216 stop:737 length:522 start_codon:yes stop_codon:yes gene_type:complete